MNISLCYFPGGKKKALTMSYDDGQISDRRLVEIFNRYGIKGTFHLNSGKFGTEPYLSASEIKDLFKGHEVSVHSRTHPFLTLSPKEELAKEILEDRRRLEAAVGYPVRGMSYPFGDYNDDLVEVLPHFGIEYCRTVQSHGQFTLPNNFLTWHPTCHHNQNLMSKWDQFINARLHNHMLLFYVWGHSFEFDRHNNWDLIEEFCKTASNNEQVWYATNIEIVDYVKAMKSLKFSVDRDMVYNPSCMPVWIGVDGEAVVVEPGKTISL